MVHRPDSTEVKQLFSKQQPPEKLTPHQIAAQKRDKENRTELAVKKAQKDKYQLDFEGKRGKEAQTKAGITIMDILENFDTPQRSQAIRRKCDFSESRYHQAIKRLIKSEHVIGLYDPEYSNHKRVYILHDRPYDTQKYKLVVA